MSRVFVGEFRFVTSLPFQSRERKIRVIDSGMGMALESKARRELAAAMGILVSILSRQAGL